VRGGTTHGIACHALQCCTKTKPTHTATHRGMEMSTIAAQPYPFTLSPRHCALLLIDMQRDFLEPDGFGSLLGNDVQLLRRTIAPTVSLLRAARAAQMLIVHTREGHRPDLADLPPAKKGCRPSPI
jgi:hypothetical protein